MFMTARWLGESPIQLLYTCCATCRTPRGSSSVHAGARVAACPRPSLLRRLGMGEPVCSRSSAADAASQKAAADPAAQNASGRHTLGVLCTALRRVCEGRAHDVLAKPRHHPDVRYV